MGRGPELFQREKLLASIYAVTRFPGSRFYLNKPVGPIVVPESFRDAPPNITRILSAMRRKADLIVVLPTFVLIAEAKIRPTGEEVGQLLVYRRLFAATPEFQDVKGRPVKLKVLSYIDDVVVRAVASDLGIDWEVFAPKQVTEMIGQSELGRLRQFQQGLAASQAALAE